MLNTILIFAYLFHSSHLALSDYLLLKLQKGTCYKDIQDIVSRDYKYCVQHEQGKNIRTRKVV